MSELFYNARNLIESNGFGRNPERYLEEFLKEPALNADLQPTSADDNNDGATAAEIATMNAANKDFEVWEQTLHQVQCHFQQQELV